MSTQQYGCALERLPHLANKITLMWGQPELDQFFADLIMDSRDGARQGLPMDVASEIAFLTQTNKLVRAINLAQSLHLSLKEAYSLVDEGDQKRLEADILDNPRVSRDTVRRERPGNTRRAAVAKRPAPPARGPISLLGKAVVYLIFNKRILVGFIMTALGLKLVGPVLAQLLIILK